MASFMRRAVLTGNALIVIIFLLTEILTVFQLRSFEYPYLWRLLGMKGVLFLSTLHIGLLLIALRVHLRFARGQRVIRRSEVMMHAVTIILMLWLLEWVFIEIPVSRHINNFFISDQHRDDVTERAIKAAREAADIEQMFPGLETIDRPRMAVSLARGKLDAPEVYAVQPLGKTIAKYAQKYRADPTLLFSYLYHNSFDGEAVSGPMPFFKNLNGEGFRDLVQVHLPSRFIENPVRIWLITNDYLEQVFGQNLGWKLRYALQKATYDVSCGPYNTDVFTALFLVLKEYKSEFPELFYGDRNDLDRALGDSFAVLEDRVLQKPYGDAYSHVPMDASYYAKYRDDLITYSRAAFYKLRFDFDFATKVEALLVRYNYDDFARELGDDIWSRVSEEQRLSLIVMTHDMYKPNVGRLGYHLYMGPELILASAPFIVSAARADVMSVTDHSAIWRPPEYEKLWGAATKKLRLFSEMWKIVTGKPLPKFETGDTFADALDVLVHHTGNSPL